MKGKERLTLHDVTNFAPKGQMVIIQDLLHNLVIPVKTGIQREILGRFVWILAYAGMTVSEQVAIITKTKTCRRTDCP